MSERYGRRRRVDVERDGSTFVRIDMVYSLRTLDATAKNLISRPRFVYSLNPVVNVAPRRCPHSFRTEYNQVNVGCWVAFYYKKDEGILLSQIAGSTILGFLRSSTTDGNMLNLADSLMHLYTVRYS